MREEGRKRGYKLHLLFLAFLVAVAEGWVAETERWVAEAER
jgi:hypothetical protein